MSTGNVVQTYNRYRNLDTIVGYDVQVDADTARKLGIYTSENKNAVQALIRVEKTSKTRAFPVSISCGFVKYAPEEYTVSLLKEDIAEKGLLMFSELEKNDENYKKAYDIAVDAVIRYELEHGEFLANKRECLDFVPIASNTETEVDEEYEM